MTKFFNLNRQIINLDEVLYFKITQFPTTYDEPELYFITVIFNNGKFIEIMPLSENEKCQKSLDDIWKAIAMHGMDKDN